MQPFSIALSSVIGDYWRVTSTRRSAKRPGPTRSRSKKCHASSFCKRQDFRRSLPTVRATQSQTPCRRQPPSTRADSSATWLTRRWLTLTAPTSTSSSTVTKPSAIVEKAELDKLKQVRNEVADGTRSQLAPGFKFWPVSMDPRGRSGPNMAQLHKWVAEHGSTTSRNNSAAKCVSMRSFALLGFKRFRALRAVR